MRTRLIALFFCFTALPAAAELTITPLRQALDADNPVATYRLSNPSSRIIMGRIGLIDLTATETGYLPATPSEREAISAAPLLSVRPASVRLEPGASATVTVSLRDPASLAREPKAIERRSHLLIQSGAPRTPLRKASGGIELDLGLGLSTPVVVRAGSGDAGARIGETRLVRNADGVLELETVIEPEGPFSAYGRLEIAITPSEEESARGLASLGNIAAWRDAPRRRFTAPLGVKELPAGVLEIRYLGAAEYEGRVFARRTFQIAPPG